MSVCHGAVVACAFCLAALGHNDYADLEDYAEESMFLNVNFQ